MSAFPASEYAARLARAQEAMNAAGIGALLMTTEAEFRYFTGFLTRFWESPSRPWFLIVPASGAPVAVIPSIGAALMAQTGVQDIRTWSAPTPGDDGVTLLIETLKEVGGPVAMPMGPETVLRMPMEDFLRVTAAVPIGPDGGLVARLRAVKSEAEVEKIRTSCAIAGRAFDRVGEVAGEGRALSEVFRGFQQLCLQEGADWVPYLAGGAGPFGYEDVISPATDQALTAGDVLMLDTGLIRDGYFCDYDRNFVIGHARAEQESAWDVLLEATEAGRRVLRPGNTASDVFHAMKGVLDRHGGGEGVDPGRIGHGLGLQLTEGLSLIAADHTMLEEGMVLTLEPGVVVRDGALMVHEDNYVIRAGGAEQLSPLAPERLPVI